MAPVRLPVPVGPNHKGFPMRSLLTFGKTLVSCLLAASLTAAVSQGETITWIDPPETRSIGVAEASWAKSLDVDHATVTRGSLAALSDPAPTPIAQPVVAAPVSIELPLAVKTAITAKEAASEKTEFGATLPWMAINSRPAKSGIDPYPSWGGAALVVDDVTTLPTEDSDLDTYTGGYQAVSLGLSRKGFAMAGSRFLTP
ncbi:MAG: hypothetical protein FJ309_10150 [Planctomycetes bacterium]|nr:hypothetical protein [Planctomycetota bacterium]